MVQRGTFIVFEGLDRCGKTTQVARLEESLRRKGQSVRTQKFPGELFVSRTPIALSRTHTTAFTNADSDALVLLCFGYASLDRTTAIGKMIDSYLNNTTEMDDRAIHLLFSANRWECA